MAETLDDTIRENARGPAEARGQPPQNAILARSHLQNRNKSRFGLFRRLQGRPATL